MASMHFDPDAFQARAQSRNSKRDSFTGRASRPNSQAYKRYSLTSIQGESTLELRPSNPLGTQEEVELADAQIETSATAKERPSSPPDSEAGHHATLRNPSLQGGRVRYNSVICKDGDLTSTDENCWISGF